jgi:diguanylate cyclase (GGDEF)-like protein
MITLKKYLDSPLIGSEDLASPEKETILPAVLAAYGFALLEMGDCSVVAIPALGDDLKQSFARLQARLSVNMSCDAVRVTGQNVQENLREWGKRTALHYQQKTHEVRELLFVMARTAESVAARDQLCASQFNEVTACLKSIATLEDLTEIRASIEKSVADLRASIQRMEEEGKVAVERLRREVSSYRNRLEEAEDIGSRDALTGLRNRLWVENQIASRIRLGVQFCVAIIDIDGFKRVNDQYGHLIGDEVLKHFASELRAACRSTDRIGRWGGDEFILVLDGNLPDATAQITRLSNWVFGSYAIDGKAGAGKIWLEAAIGLAEHQPGEAMKDLLVRADAAMYRRKIASRQAQRLG